MEHSAPLLLSVSQASEMCGLGRSLLYEKLLTGEIPSIKVNRRRLVPRAALEQYVTRLVSEQTVVAGR